MRQREHDQLQRDVAKLRELLAACSTESLVGSAFVYWVTRDSLADHDILMSAARQWTFLLGLMLSTAEPLSARQFAKEDLDRASHLLNAIFASYAWTYYPEPGEEVTEEWRRPREVAMPAFLAYMNQGFLASTDQVERRIERYLVPFDGVLQHDHGLSASSALAICRCIRDELQAAADRLTTTAASERRARIDLLDRAEREQWTIQQIRIAAQDPKYREIVSTLLSQLSDFGSVSLTALSERFGADGPAFWKLFAAARGSGAPLTYPTETNVAEVRSLYVIEGDRAMCPLANQLFLAVLLRFERHLAAGAHAERFFKMRDIALEREIEESFRRLFGSAVELFAHVFETPDQHFEHDLVIRLGRVILVVEAKASPPVEPFRDPERAFVRIKRAFKRDRGIQSAFEQARRIWRQWAGGGRVHLYTGRGQLALSFDQSETDEVLLICATRDNFGVLATDLSLLLEKEPQEPYPWCVNAIDLDAIGNAWNYFGWSGEQFLTFLRDRVKLHGRLKCTDELEAAGFFIRHGGLHDLVHAKTDYVWLTPTYSAIFDDIWKARAGSGPEVRYEPTAPDFTDAREIFASDRSRPEAQTEPPRRPKQGRNEPCACGSGKKYKKCHGSS
jgi:hypothetical protein